MNKDDMARLNKLLQSQFDDAPELQKKISASFAEVSVMLHDVYKLNREVASRIFAAVIAVAFIGTGDTIDDALALNGKLYADIRESIVKVDKVLSTGDTK